MFKTIRSPTRAWAVLIASTSISFPPPSAWQASLDEQDAQALERVVFTHAVPAATLPILNTTPSSVATAPLSIHAWLDSCCQSGVDGVFDRFQRPLIFCISVADQAALRHREASVCAAAVSKPCSSSISCARSRLSARGMIFRWLAATASTWSTFWMATSGLRTFSGRSNGMS
jgi:hypothetical protein